MQTVLPFLFVKTHATKNPRFDTRIEKNAINQSTKFFFLKNRSHNKLNYFDWL